MKIGNKNIGLDYPPFVIAEMSGNHNQSIETALNIVKAAADAGAHALKLQTYTPQTITLNASQEEFFIRDKKSIWNGKKLHNLYMEAHTPWEWHEEIFKEAKKNNILAFSTPFDETAVEFLETLNVPAYKIASFEAKHIPLIRKIASTGKPMIISTGMCEIHEISETVTEAKKAGCNEIILLKCTSTYPSSPLDSNILTIPHMRNLFQLEIGLSDHTMGVGASVAAVAHGATVIEKHFTISRKDGGVDSTFSLEPDELKSLVIETERAWQSLGSISYGTSKSEMNSRQFRQSLYIAEDMNKGDVLNEVNLRVVRPGFGLDPKFKDILLGNKVNKNLKKGTRVTWDIVLNI